MEFEQLKEYLGEIPVYDLLYGQKSYEDAALAYFKCRRAGITIRSSVDLIIAQTAIENNLFLFHNDNDFVQLAAVMPELRLLP
jgi:predicted nucleic acid-binding protein